MKCGTRGWIVGMKKQVIIAYTKVPQLTKNNKKGQSICNGLCHTICQMPQLIKRINHNICLGPTSSAGQMRMKRWKKSDNHDFIFSYATVKEKTPVSASAS